MHLLCIDNGNGTMSPVPVQFDPTTGCYSPASIPQNQMSIPKGTAGCQCVSSRQYDKIRRGIYQSSNSSILTTESVLGDESSARITNSGTNATDGQMFTVTLNNTTANDVDVPLGDGLGNVSEALGLPAVPVGLVVSGFRGANSLQKLLLYSQQSALKVASLRLVATGAAGPAAIFAAANITIHNADKILSNTRPNDLSVATWPSSGDFTIAIQESQGFRFLFEPNTAMVVKVPANSQISLSMLAVEDERGFILKKYGQI